MKRALLLLLFSSSLSADELPFWISGWWKGDASGVRMEEVWTAPGGGVMIGMHRDVMPDGKTSFEFIRIESKGGKITYQAQPGGRSPATPFPLKSATASRVVFENPEHDFPQRIIYWLDGKRLCARVEGKMGGKDAAEQWCWSRVSAAAR